MTKSSSLFIRTVLVMTLFNGPLSADDDVPPFGDYLLGLVNATQRAHFTMLGSDLSATQRIILLRLHALVLKMQQVGTQIQEDVAGLRLSSSIPDPKVFARVQFNRDYLSRLEESFQTLSKSYPLFWQIWNERCEDSQLERHQKDLMGSNIAEVSKAVAQLKDQAEEIFSKGRDQKDFFFYFSVGSGGQLSFASSPTTMQVAQANGSVSGDDLGTVLKSGVTIGTTAAAACTCVFPGVGTAVCLVAGTVIGALAEAIFSRAPYIQALEKLRTYWDGILSAAAAITNESTKKSLKGHCEAVFNDPALVKTLHSLDSHFSALTEANDTLSKQTANSVQDLDSLYKEGILKNLATLSTFKERYQVLFEAQLEEESKQMGLVTQFYRTSFKPRLADLGRSPKEDVALLVDKQHAVWDALVDGDSLFMPTNPEGKGLLNWMSYRKSAQEMLQVSRKGSGQ